MRYAGAIRAVDVDDVLERLRRAARRRRRGLHAAHLVAQESEDLLILFAAPRVDGRDLLPHARGLGPLMLVFVQLLQVDEARSGSDGSSRTTS